jgi:hypothetical protein
MEQLAEIWESVVASMRALPPPHDPDLMVVVATIVGGLGLAAATNGWVERRVSKSGVFATLVGVLSCCSGSGRPSRSLDLRLSRKRSSK